MEELGAFSELLKDHLRSGIGREKPGLASNARWNAKDFAERCGVSDRLVRSWKSGRLFPSNLQAIERTFFGLDEGQFTAQRDLLRGALARAKRAREFERHGHVKELAGATPEPLKIKFARGDLKTRDDLLALGVFELYEKTFPKDQRIPELDICEYIFELDLGKAITINVGNASMPYYYDSELAVLVAGRKAVGLALYSYAPDKRLVFFSYIAVDEEYRGKGGAKFIQKIRGRLTDNKRFKGCRGVVFEVTTFDRLAVLDIVERCEASGVTLIEDAAERRIIEDFRLVGSYSSAHLFVDEVTRDALVYIYPCVDEEAKSPDEWEAHESTMLLMFYHFGDRDYSKAGFQALWSDSVGLAIDAIGVGQVTHRPDWAAQYLDYMKELSRRIEAENRESLPTICQPLKERWYYELHNRQKHLVLKGPKAVS